jgi:hypothetical protein
VRDFVQAQGFLSQQPNLESSATFTSRLLYTFFSLGIDFTKKLAPYG